MGRRALGFTLSSSKPEQAPFIVMNPMHEPRCLHSLPCGNSTQPPEAPNPGTPESQIQASPVHVKEGPNYPGNLESACGLSCSLASEAISCARPERQDDQTSGPGFAERLVARMRACGLCISNRVSCHNEGGFGKERNEQLFRCLHRLTPY